MQVPAFRTSLRVGLARGMLALTRSNVSQYGLLGCGGLDYNYGIGAVGEIPLHSRTSCTLRLFRNALPSMSRLPLLA
jgi:hypothetical protein